MRGRGGGAGARTGGRTEQVLELDGNGSFVELSPNIFNRLTNATVEAWVKWNRLDDYQSFFSYGGENNDFTIRFHRDF